MDTGDRLINSLYCMASDGEWRSFRAQALTLVCGSLGADAGAWWTRSLRHSAGELTQFPQEFITIEALARVVPEAGAGHTVSTISPTAVAFVYAQAGSELLHTLAFNFPQRNRRPADELLTRIGAHMSEAAALSTLQFVRRDDWLHGMGRANRGSAALVDASGAVYALSSRFSALLEEIGEDKAAARLPFVLPEDALGENGGEFTSGDLHLRVSTCGTLYLLHARKPLPLDALSPREQEIARAISNGKTLKSIARQYGIAVSTVANHTTRIYRKLAIYRREDLIQLLRARPGNAG